MKKGLDRENVSLTFIRKYCRLVTAYYIDGKTGLVLIATCTELSHYWLPVADPDANPYAIGTSCDRHQLSTSAPSCSAYEAHRCDEGLDHAPSAIS